MDVHDHVLLVNGQRGIMYLVELPKAKSGFRFKVECVVIAETEMSMSNLVYKRKTRQGNVKEIKKPNHPNLYMYSAALSLMYVKISNFPSRFFFKSKKEVTHCQRLFHVRKREEKTSITSQRLVMQPDHRSHTSYFPTHRVMRL